MAFLPPVPGGAQQQGMGSLVSSSPSNGSPQQAQSNSFPQMGDETAANEGSIMQLRQVELQIGEISQTLTQMAKAYPGAAEDSRTALSALDAARQSLTGFLVSIVSQMQSPQPQAPRYGAL